MKNSAGQSFAAAQRDRLADGDENLQDSVLNYSKRRISCKLLEICENCDTIATLDLLYIRKGFCYMR